MSLADSLTPKDTEEVKPGLFIQKRKNGYKQILPLAWDGKILWKQQLRTVFSFRTFFTIAIILFLAWSYLHDVQEYKSFYERVTNNPVQYCTEISDKISSIQNDNSSLSLTQGGFKHADTYNLSDYR